MNTFILAQIVGILTTVSAVISMQFKDMKWVLVSQVVSNLLTALNLALLGGLSGAGICITATVQTVVIFMYKLKDKQLPTEFSIVFAAVYTVCSLAAYNSVFDIIALIAALTYAMSVIQAKSSAYRIYILINSLLWVAYDISIGAYTAIITYVILITSIVIAMIRIDFKKTNKLHTEEGTL